MLTNNILSCYNHLLATSLIYFTFVDPLQELSSSLNGAVSPETQDQIHHGSFSFITLASAAEETRDYYEILGVAKDATKHDIHKAFRSLAKKYHPDKNKEKGAQDEFIKIFKAYETLSDEKKRKEYDERDKASNHGAFGGAGGGTSGGSWQTHQMNDFDMNEFFRQYTEQLNRHAGFYQQGHGHDHDHYHQHQQHHKASHFHGINLDDLFHDIDQDEIGRLFDFGSHHQHLQANLDEHFGDGASFFGSHFPSQIHDTIHQYQNLRAGSGGHHYSGGSAYSCHTVTQKVNGVVMTQTSCG